MQRHWQDMRVAAAAAAAAARVLNRCRRASGKRKNTHIFLRPLCRDLAFAALIQTSQLAPCDLSAPLGERLRLKEADASAPPEVSERTAV